MNIDKITKLIEVIKEEIGDKNIQISLNSPPDWRGLTGETGKIDGVYLAKSEMFFKKFKKSKCIIIPAGEPRGEYSFAIYKVNGIVFYTFFQKTQDREWA